MPGSAAMWLAAAAAFGAAWILTGALRRRNLRAGRLDVPGARSSHTTPTPTGGGASIVAVCLAAWLALPLADAAALWLLVGGGGAVALLGYVDDRSALPSAVRLAVHVLCGVAAVFLAVSYTHLTLPTILRV